MFRKKNKKSNKNNIIELRDDVTCGLVHSPSLITLLTSTMIRHQEQLQI
jgi:hypothetical protein